MREECLRERVKEKRRRLSEKKTVSVVSNQTRPHLKLKSRVLHSTRRTSNTSHDPGRVSRILQSNGVFIGRTMSGCSSLYRSFPTLLLKVEILLFLREHKRQSTFTQEVRPPGSCTGIWRDPTPTVVRPVSSPAPESPISLLDIRVGSVPTGP